MHVHAGSKVHGGDLVLYSAYNMGRSESLWGEDCEEFKPERWLVDGKFKVVVGFLHFANVCGSVLSIGVCNAPLSTCVFNSHRTSFRSFKPVQGFVSARSVWIV